MFPTKMKPRKCQAEEKKEEKQSKRSERSGKRETRRLKVKTGTVQCVIFLPPAHIFNMRIGKANI